MAYVIVSLILAALIGLAFGQALVMLGQAAVDLARTISRRRAQR